MLDIERHLDARQARRMASDDRFLGRINKRETAAEQMIGELVRDGRTVFYIFPVGGKYREGMRSDLVAFLIRNRYV